MDNTAVYGWQSFILKHRLWHKTWILLGLSEEGEGIGRVVKVLDELIDMVVSGQTTIPEAGQKRGRTGDAMETVAAFICAKCPSSDQKSD